jgi:hypothetical protein
MMKRFEFSREWSIAVAAGLLIAGCGTIDTANIDQGTGPLPMRRPSKFLVMNFATTEGMIVTDRPPKEQARFEKDLGRMMAKAIASRLTQHLAPAEAINDPMKLPRSGWLVRGALTNVVEIDPTLRAMGTPGANRTRLEAKIWIYDLSQSYVLPFLIFRARGHEDDKDKDDTQALGAVNNELGPEGGLAVSMSEDVLRAARMATSTLAEYIHRRGWTDAQGLLETPSANE